MAVAVAVAAVRQRVVPPVPTPVSDTVMNAPSADSDYLFLEIIVL